MSAVLIDLEFDVALTGFSLAEVDFVLDAAQERKEKAERIELADRVRPVPAEAVARRGDLWALGKHRLICGDAREPCWGPSGSILSSPIRLTM